VAPNDEGGLSNSVGRALRETGLLLRVDFFGRREIFLVRATLAPLLLGFLVLCALDPFLFGEPLDFLVGLVFLTFFFPLGFVLVAI
jgi:hypothetical protein